MNLLKATLGKHIAAQALSGELHLPWSALGHSPSEVVLKGYGYGEWALTRPGVVGPTVSELIRSQGDGSRGSFKRPPRGEAC